MVPDEVEEGRMMMRTEGGRSLWTRVGDEYVLWQRPKEAKKIHWSSIISKCVEVDQGTGELDIDCITNIIGALHQSLVKNMPFSQLLSPVLVRGLLLVLLWLSYQKIRVPIPSGHRSVMPWMMELRLLLRKFKINAHYPCS